MDGKYQQLKLIFKAVSPERQLEQIRRQRVAILEHIEKPRTWIHGFDQQEYALFGRSVREYDLLTMDEINQRSSILEQWLTSYAQSDESGGAEHNPRRGTLFDILAQYGEENLYLEASHLYCKSDRFLEWRELSLELGQDLFTCCHLAELDVNSFRKRGFSLVLSQRKKFDWPAILPMYSNELQSVLNEGISENHFHLNGSTQIFPIAWAFLMNYPQEIQSYFSKGEFQILENMQGHLSFGVQDNCMSWRDRLYYAAWIRAKLCETVLMRSEEERTEQTIYEDFLRFDRCCDKLKQVRNTVDASRFYAAKFDFQNGSKALDYAITRSIACQNQGANRLLAGERYFLYRCFLRCFLPENMNIAFTDQEKDLLYLYLLIKIRFREELIQVNRRRGFRNFSDYQSRKATVWGEERTFFEYQEEAYRMAVAGTFEPTSGITVPSVRSLEMRIMPSSTPEKQRMMINQTDEIIRRGFYNCENEERIFSDDRLPYFYTIHFGKQPLKKIKMFGKNQCRVGNGKIRWIYNGAIPEARNEALRKAVKKKAMAIGQLLKTDSEMCRRIRGIDACSNEIGCRPETFATAFRYLRNLQEGADPFMISRRYNSKDGFSSFSQPSLGGTYHAGEDFLDLVDGIRAIDEAICFLNLKDGDRIGHALALGTEPEKYYRVKRQQIVLPKQDLLDNLVWLLYRSLDWGVNMPFSLEKELRRIAEQYLYEIYGDGYWDNCFERNQDNKNGRWLPVTLDTYYKSWQLRGDDPKVYEEAVRIQKEVDLENYLKNLHDGVGKYGAFDEYECSRLDLGLWKYRNQKSSAIMEQAFEERRNRAVQYLLFYYHYGAQVRERGQKSVSFDVSEEYIVFSRIMQECLMINMEKMRIGVECNPSSNMLIGTFDKYDQHPIFRFNHEGLDLMEMHDTNTQLNVSVNTDDLGVFDTSLENEYALIYQCLMERKQQTGETKLTSSSIRNYMSHLREMSNRMTFPEGN